MTDMQTGNDKPDASVRTLSSSTSVQLFNLTNGVFQSKATPAVAVQMTENGESVVQDKPASENKKVRSNGMDLLRVLACLLVMQQHCGELYYIGDIVNADYLGPHSFLIPDNDNPRWVGIPLSLGRVCVPLFVVISGFLLLPLKTDIPTFFKKRLPRVVLPFVIWCVFYAIYYASRKMISWSDAFENMLKTSVNYGTEIGHLWYVYMHIGLYLFAPIISPFLQSASHGALLYYFAVWAVTLFVPYIHTHFPYLWGECFWTNTPLQYYFSGLLGYMFMGFYLKKFLAEPKLWHRLGAFAAIVAGYFVTLFIYLSRLDTKYTDELELSYGFDTINVAAMTFGFALLLKDVRFPNQNSWYAWLIGDISKMSYGMYLCHIMYHDLFFWAFDSVFDFVLIKLWLICISTFVCSYVTVKAISLIPYSWPVSGVDDASKTLTCKRYAELQDEPLCEDGKPKPAVEQPYQQLDK